jgi:enterochelin esterase-like enzyme
VRSFIAWGAVFLILGVAVAHATLVRRHDPQPSRASLASARAETLTEACRSPSLGGSILSLVYLPAGYGTSSTRYPVIYVLHGLPAGPQTYAGSGFVAAAVATGSRPAIVVTPQGALSQNSDPEYLDRGLAEDWPRAIGHDLTRCIDARFQTIAKRRGRALVGFSAGGFGAMNIGLRNLATYGAVESWSGYFEATDPGGEHVLDLGSPAANAAARVPRGPALRRALERRPTFIGFYVGEQDKTFLADNRTFDAALHAGRIPHSFAVYPGGHAVSLWVQQAPHWLGLALSALAKGR